MNEVPSSFAALLRHYRRGVGLTQEALAERAGVSARAVSDLERGLYLTPRRDTVTLLAAALGLGPADAARLEGAVARRGRPRPPLPGGPDGRIPFGAGPGQGAGVYTAGALPVALTGLIGREQVVDAVSALLVDPEVRLVTLSGPAGVGKTRLALAVAAGVQPRFADGALFVPLETIADPDLVLPAVARAAAVTAAPGEALDAVLFEAIQARHLLLVLDNFEQIVDAAPQVAVLLTACPSLTALVTSRAALRVRGERLVPVPPLAEPDAVRLFLERARAMAPEAAPDETATIADICHRLDGLPLAIELAAARTRLLPPHEVLARLTQPLTLLTGGPRDLPERHQALREAIAWSYDLLTPDEQAVFRRLAVFAGGCTLEAAATVCAASGSLEIDPLDGLEVLVDHSLVRRERDGGDAGTRLRLLETLREFAWDRLSAAGEQAVAERAHARVYLELAERAVGELIGPTLGLWLDRLEREHDNLRRALRWAVEGCEVAIALRLGAALSRFWALRGHYREGWRWLEESLALPGVATVSPAVRSRALNAAGILALTCNEYGRAEVLFEEGLVAARASGDALLVAEALNSVGGAARARGDADRAVALFEEALSLPGVSAYPRAVARSLFNLAMVSRDQEDFDRADALLRQCRDLQGLLGDRQAVAVTLNVLGSVAFARGERARAAALHREGLALQEAIGHKRGLAISYSFMCAEAAAAGDALEAADVCRRALLACREIGERWNTAECLASLARVTALRGRPDGAARLLGAAARQRAGSLNPQEQRSAEAQLMAEVRAHLGATAFDARWAEGQALSFDGAVALGLAAAAAARRPERTRPPRPRAVREG